MCDYCNSYQPPRGAKELLAEAERRKEKRELMRKQLELADEQIKKQLEFAADEQIKMQLGDPSRGLYVQTIADALKREQEKKAREAADEFMEYVR